MNDVVDAKSRPDVSIVIVSWNVARLLADCLRSIQAVGSSSLTIETIVVDNASSDDSLTMLATEFPWVTLIASPVNLGFARANNLGFRQAHGKYIFILNPDTVLPSDALPKLMAVLDQQPIVGIAGPRLIFPDGTVQKASARLLRTLRYSLFCQALKLCSMPIIGRWLNRRLHAPYDYNVSQEVEAISGAAMLVRSELIDQLGGFGEDFMHAGEDLEFCFRFRKAGWKVYYVSDAFVTHFESQSSNQASIRTMINGALSVQVYFDRCYGKLHGRLYQLIVQCIQAPMLVMLGLVKRGLRQESSTQMRQRWITARALWRWQVYKD